MKRSIRRVLLAGAFIWLPVAAQPFPAGPIHVVVPLAPGDTADTTARVLSEEIARLLNTSLQAINRPGAGGALGANSVVQARKDGQTAEIRDELRRVSEMAKKTGMLK